MSVELKSQVDELFRTLNGEFKDAAKQAKDEVKKLGEETAETKAKLQRANDRMDEIEAQFKASFKAQEAKKNEMTPDAESKKYSELFGKKMFGKGVNHEEENQYSAFKNAERKTMRTDVQESGGILVPMEYERTVIRKIYENSPVFNLARRFELSEGDSKQIPIIGDRIAFGGRGNNIIGATQTTGMKFDAKVISVNTYWAYPYVTQDLLDDSYTSVEALMSDEAAMLLADTASTDAVNGALPMGVKGFLTNLPSARLQISGSDTAFDADDLISMYYNGLKTGYARNASWGFSRQTLGYIRKFTAADDNYLWQPGLQAGAPALLLGRPYAEFADLASPNSGTNNFAENDKPVVLADWQKFYGFIVKRGLTVKRDDITTPALVKYYFSWRVGGDRLLDEAGVVLNINNA